MSETEPNWDLLDAVTEGLTESFESPSTIARKAKVSTGDVHSVLGWLVRNHYAVPAGNGAWTKYRARRAGDPVAA